MKCVCPVTAGGGCVSCDEQVSLLAAALYLHHLQHHFLQDWQRQHLTRMDSHVISLYVTVTERTVIKATHSELNAAFQSFLSCQSNSNISSSDIILTFQTWMNTKLTGFTERRTFSDQRKQMSKTRRTDTKMHHGDKQTKTGSVLYLPLCSPLTYETCLHVNKIANWRKYPFYSLMNILHRIKWQWESLSDSSGYSGLSKQSFINHH